jgi:hypothetical protein
MYAQEACTDYSPIMRFVCQVGRFRTTAVPTNDGLFIGLVTLAVLNDNTKLHDPSQWQWAGYLPTLTGGTPVVPSWLCVDVNLAWTPTTPLFLLMCTNGSYEVCGWDMCGYVDTSFPQVQNLGEYNYNEPNKPNGWTVMDNRYKGAIHIYSPPAGQVVEGLSDIVNPVFCTTVQAGANCAFSFNVNQLTAFPCGCPETIVWQLFNRDTGVALGAATQYLLACGYTGVTGFGGNLVFTGAGVFHGQLKAGHLNADGTTWTVDDTYNFDVTVTALPCTTYTTKATCQAAGCYWWNGSCHSAAPTCTQLNNQTDCLAYSCYWYNNQCNSNPPPNTTIATIDSGVYHTGPYSAGQLVELAVIQVRNTGNTAGKLYGCSFFNPGQANEIRNTQSEVNIAANGVWDYHPVAEIPANQQPGSLPVGVKVWGATETEPGWSLSQSLRGDVEIW